MPFDPTKPVEGTPVDAAEMRGQLNGLKALNDAKPSMDQVNDAIAANSAGSVSDIEPLAIFASNPPTQLEVQTVINFLNDMLAAMKRQ